MEISQTLMLLTFICFKNTITQAQIGHGHAHALMDIHMNENSPQSGSATAQHILDIHIFLTTILNTKIGSCELSRYHRS